MPTTTYAHFRDVPESAWRWPSFSPAEIACRGTGRLLVNDEALDRLQALRRVLGRPMIVNSAYRSPEHNARVGGATKSQHLSGAAFDISMANHDPESFIAAAREAAEYLRELDGATVDTRSGSALLSWPIGSALRGALGPAPKPPSRRSRSRSRSRSRAS